ncbi:MAG: deoxyribose-phosphate aldolase/phospho-2-dehydro-3-deoxyheptonate aldolase [Verrucomicrobiaceae bacterium]|nr:deoxyribose-phosphate aldolase/phospho-2-dehydro-3-deoxyheptonate aldolase [Verrucomicrobiaceae bacterium]
MADIDTSKSDKKEKEFFTHVPQEAPGFFLKGSHQYDWGLKNRLSRIFNPKDGRTVMLAFDHGYFQGPTTGLERVDQTILPLEPYADCLMLTRGIQRSVIPASTTKAIALRASGGTSMVSPMEEWEGEVDGKKIKLSRPGFEPLSNESTALTIEEAIRLNASVLAVQVFIGSAYERQSLKNLTDLVDAASRYGIAVMGVTAVGRSMARTAQYFRLATRIMAELGANVVKCYYTETEFDTVTSCCPVPIVIAGGKKLPELEALQMSYNAIQQGASGVDMGRNIFQADAPVAMMRAVQALVHGGLNPDEAFQMYNDLKNGK